MILRILLAASLVCAAAPSRGAKAPSGRRAVEARLEALFALRELRVDVRRLGRGTVVYSCGLRTLRLLRRASKDPKSGFSEVSEPAPGPGGLRLTVFYRKYEGAAVRPQILETRSPDGALAFRTRLGVRARRPELFYNLDYGPAVLESFIEELRKALEEK